MSPKLCWAEHCFLAGKPKIVSLLRRGCRRRDLPRSTAKYLGGHRTDPEQRGYTERHYQTLERQRPQLNPPITPLPPGTSPCQRSQRNQSGWQGNTPTLAELGSNSKLPLACVRHSAQTWQQQDIFPVHCGLAQGISGNPHGSSTVPAVPSPEQAVPFPAGLLPPAL